MDKILQSREEKALIINEYLKKYPNVIVIKANIPGINKNIPEAFILVNIFKNILNSYKDYTYIDNHESHDGPFMVFSCQGKSIYDIKNMLSELEDTHPLGRLIDLDVYVKDGVISRNNLRRCFICNEPFNVCRRINTHSIDELLLFIKTSVTDYLCKVIFDTINTAMITELNLHPKFGLVTPYSSGSHLDMNYELMIKAKDVIIPYFIDMFKVGYSSDPLDIKFNKARLIGLEAENAMNKATGQVNTYKGLIFILGLIETSLGHLLFNNQHESMLYENIKEMCKDIFKDIEKLDKTPGISFYQSYQFKGARGEAKEGLPSVAKIVNDLDKYDVINDEVLTLLLIKILYLTDDSVLLKRSGSIEKYQFNKELITSVKEYDKARIEEVTDYCIKNNLSLGGCADLLVASLFVHYIKKQIL